jgi:hypothetical protein
LARGHAEGNQAVSEASRHAGSDGACLVRRVRANVADIRARLEQQIGGTLPSQRKHLQLLAWAAGVLRGQRFHSAFAIECALYEAQRAVKVPNGDMVFVLRDLSKLIYGRIEDLRSVGIAA